MSKHMFWLDKIWYFFILNLLN